MAFQFCDLDTQTRGCMLEELERDVENDTIYWSRRLQPGREPQYEELLRQAIVDGNEQTLAGAIRRASLLVARETYRTSSGQLRHRKVRRDAPEVLAEGEFNRYYVRAVCLRAIAERHESVEVYRAKVVERPRPESEFLTGQHLDPERLLHDVRTHPGVDTALGVPAGPNSGLSVRLPAAEDQWADPQDEFPPDSEALGA